MFPVHVRPDKSSSSCAGSKRVKPTAKRGTHIVRPGLPCNLPESVPRKTALTIHPPPRPTATSFDGQHSTNSTGCTRATRMASPNSTPSTSPKPFS
ncbi:hypothetical protein PGTUg99_019657 [Puccinia graminis f. sp. tritici]|uniref:Uncharacterized protein n=1 Tax=Puccinia graminis f. sp. tritici TaxID=56615 RepID=A0A5B0LWE3_PUCGR|nr:hypothetical protein PGTUg99_019657 [Puccinia graminis f. sp. tritici]